MKKTQETFAQEERFRVAQELSLDGFAILKAVREKGQVVDFEWDYVNPAAARMVRFSPQELRGKSLRQTLPQAGKSGLLTDFISIMESGEPLDAEVGWETAKTSGWWRTMAVKLGDGIAVSWRDITEKKRWEENLKQSEARFKVITQSQMIGLFFWDEKEKILDANEAFLRILGYRYEQFFKKTFSWKELTPAEFWEKDKEALAEVKKNGTCKPFEKELFRQDGRRLPVLLGAARLPAINCEGVAFVVDISEKKAIEKQREILLGHELKTPLAGIKSLAQLLQKRGEKEAGMDKKAREYLNKINQKADWLTSLINDLTDWSRASAGQLEFMDELWDFDQMVREKVADFQAGVETHQIVCQGKTNRVVRVDKKRFLQVLENLLSNAVKYSPQAKQVLVSLGTQKDKVVLAVQDFGVGISPEDQERLFQPFFRSSQSKDLAPGVGVGLSICDEILKHYEGKIKVESQPGKGSCFKIFLPFEKSATIL